MKRTIFILFVLTSALFFACAPKNRVDELVYFSEQNKASNEVYINFLTEQIRRYPEGEDKYLKLADIYNNNHNSAAAIKLLQQAEKQIPESINILVGLSTLYLENQNIQELSRTLNAIRKIDPDNMNYLKLSAGYSLLLRDFTNAIFFANRAMLANPFDDEILYLRGSAMLINQDSTSALMSFEEAYKLMDSYKNFSKVFDLSVALKNYDISKKYLDEFGGRYLAHSLCYEKGVYFYEIGKSDSAKILLKECLTKEEKEPRIYFELAKIYFDENITETSRQYINQYLNLKPDEIDGYIMKAQIMEKTNNFPDAYELYSTALEMDSTSRLASAGLENLERKVAYLQLVKRKESFQRQVETLKPLNSKEIN